MADQVELLFKFNTEGAPQLDSVQKIVEQLGQKSALTGGQINLVEAALSSLVKQGKSTQEALAMVASSSASVGKEAAGAAKGLLEEAAASAAVGAASKVAADGIRNVNVAAHATVTEMAAASAAVRGFEGALSIRATENFLTKILGFGPALQAIFPLIGAAAFVEVLGQGVEKVGALYNAWDPVIKAEQKSLEILKNSTKELESMIARSERLTLETRKRQFGSEFEGHEKADNAKLDAIEAQRQIDRIKQQIADTQARVTAGAATGPQAVTLGSGATVYAPGRGETSDAKAAREKLHGLDAQLEDAIYKYNNAIKDQVAEEADITKGRTDKARESARKVDAINRQIEAIKERALALADKAELGTGPLASIEEARRAENRRFDREKADLAASVRENNQLGPDSARTPQSAFDRQAAAIDAAHQQALLALSAEKLEAQRKAAEAYADSVANINHEWDKWEQHLSSERLKEGEARIRAIIKAHDDLVKATEKSNRVAELGDKADESGLQLQFKKSSRLAELGAPIGSTSGAIDAAQNAYQQRLVLIRAIDEIEQRGIDRAAALSKLKGDEYDKDLAVAQERLKLTQEEGEAAVDYAIKVAEIQRKRLEEARDTAGKIFDAIISSGKTGFADFAKGIALQQGRAIFQNVTEGLFKSTASTLGSVIPKDSPLAGLFKGTLLEPQEKTALDVHTNAMLLHARALAVASGAGGAGVTGPLAGSLPFSPSGLLKLFGSDINGLTGQPLGGNSYNDLPLNLGKGTAATASGIEGLYPNYAEEAVRYGVGNGSNSKSSNVTTAVGDAGAVIAGAYGVSSGIKQGGAKGGLGAASSALGTAAVLDPEPISKAVLAVAALVTGLAGSLLGDPKAAFDAAQTKTLNANKFKGPDAISGQFDVATGSDSFNTDFKGRTRVIIQQNITVPINAMDYESIASRSDDLAKVIGDATRAGNPDMQIAINRVVFGPGAA